MLKKIIPSLCLLFSLSAEAQQSGDITGKVFLDLCNENDTICTLTFAGVNSGVTNGHVLTEIYRVGDGQQYSYYCDSEMLKYNIGAKRNGFISYLQKLDSSFINHPLGMQLVQFYHEAFPPCH